MILKCLKQGKSGYGQTFKNIQWSFIESIENIFMLNETPSSSSSSSFGKIWLAWGLPDDETKTNFQNEYITDKFDSLDKSSQLQTCLHSEIRMIDYLIEHKIYMKLAMVISKLKYPNQITVLYLFVLY